MTNIFYFLIIACLGIGVPSVLIYWVLRRNFHQRKLLHQANLQFVTLRILVPKNNEKTPLAAEQMFAALHGIYNAQKEFQDHFSFEIASREKYIQFYIHTPTHLTAFVESQVYSQYPTADIAHVDDYTVEEIASIETGKLKFVGTELVTTNLDVYPLRTFLNFDVDPLAVITGVLSNVDKGEELWIQIITKPVPDDWQDKGTMHVKSVKAGGIKPPNIFLEAFGGFVRLLGDILMMIFAPPKEDPNKKVIKAIKEANKAKADLPGTVEEGLKGVELKSTKLGFETKIRLMSFAQDGHIAYSKLLSLVGAFKQFNILNLNGFQAGTITAGLEFYNQYRFREFIDEGFILNIEELASLYHLPNITVETPNIVWAGSKKGEPPANLPIEDNVLAEELTIFARTDFRRMTPKFGIKLADRRYHMYAIGKTGTGKSTMLENMIIDDMREGRGVAVVDPHGDLIKHLLHYVPDERTKDVIIFSPADRLFPVGFNLLENVDPELKNIVASGVVGIFKKIFGESWGPRLEYILRNTILALLDYPEATMLGVTRILVDQDFRNRVLEKVQDPVIKDFFVNEYEKYDQKFRTEAIAPIQNKVGQFLSSSTIRNIIGQPKSTINIEEIMNTGKIIFLDLSIGEIGEDASALLGAMMITKIQLAAMRRTTIPEEERRDFYLYVDEFQNFATESFAVILSEARKYHLNLIMTNQYTAQVPEEVMAAVFGNIGTLISFRVGAPDASVLMKEFEPVFEEVDLVNLDNYHIYVKMSIDGVTSPAFSACTLPREEQGNDNREEIIKNSRERFSMRREYVEEKISSIASLPKINELLTRGQKNKLPKVPPKIGETYYREVQAPGDERWYFGGGTEDTPLDEEIVQAKIAKAKEDFAEREVPSWMQERLDALEVEKTKTASGEEKPQDRDVINIHEHDEDLEADKKMLVEHLETKKPNADINHLSEGETVKVE